MIDIRHCQKQLRFGGAANIQLIADRQSGPSCGFEAIENLIQLFHPVSNNLTNLDLIPRALHYGFAQKRANGFSLDIRGYQTLLADYSIGAYWYPFDFQNILIPALLSNLGVVAIGNAYFLAPDLYDPISPHAFLISNYCADPSEVFIEGLVGIDSNFTHTECRWPVQSIEQALVWTMQNITQTPLLISAEPIQWLDKVSYYRRNN